MLNYNVFYSVNLFKRGEYAAFSQCGHEDEHSTYLASALKRFKSKHYSEVIVLIYEVTEAGINIITNEVYQNPLKKLIEINPQAKGVMATISDEPDMFDGPEEDMNDN